MALHLQVKDIDAHWKQLNELGIPLPEKPTEEEASEAGLRLARARHWERKGFPEIAAIIREVAMRELEHFVLVTSYAQRQWVEQDLRSVLQAMMDAGASERERVLAGFARELGLEEEAEFFERLSRDETEHVQRFQEALALLDRKETSTG